MMDEKAGTTRPPEKPERRKLDPDDYYRMDLPQHLWRATLQQVPEVLRPKLTRYLTRLPEMVGRGAGLLLVGEVGVGKSGIAAVVAKEATQRNLRAYWTRVLDLAEALRQRRVLPVNDGTPVAERIREVEILVLDDLRPENARDAYCGAAYLESLILSRGERGRITLVTSRMTEDQFMRDYPGLLDVTRAYLIELPVVGPNLYAAKAPTIPDAD